MNVIFAHIAKKNLLNRKIDSFIFKKFLEKSPFECAIDSYLQAKSIDFIYLICPSKDQAFIKKQLFLLPENINTERIEIISIEDNSSESFCEHNIIYDPINMNIIPAFGTWNISFLKQMIKNKNINCFLIFNIDSFWFLGPKEIDSALNEAEQYNYYYSICAEFDHLIGASAKHSILNLSKNKAIKKKKREMLKENFHNLTEISFNANVEKINEQRDQNIDQLKSLLPNIQDIIAHPQIITPELALLKKNILENPCVFSLLNQYGRNCMNKINNLISKNDFQLIVNQNFTQQFVTPKLLNIECNDKLSDNFIEIIIKTVKHWDDTNCLIIKSDKVLPLQKLTQLISGIRSYYAGYIYLQSPLMNIKDSEFKQLLIKGLDVWIIDIDHVKLGSNSEKITQSIDSYLKIKNDFFNKFIILKTKNNSSDQEFMANLIHRWQYITDGIYISDETAKNSENCFSVYTDQKTCSIVPYEITLKSCGKLSICKQDHNQIDVGDYKHWFQSMLNANKMDICNNCFDKHKYIKKEPHFMFTKTLKDKLINFLTQNNLSEAKKMILNSKIEEALNLIEKNIKFNICDNAAWDLLEFAEKHINSAHFELNIH